jgi:hypothetical protein
MPAAPEGGVSIQGLPLLLWIRHVGKVGRKLLVGLHEDVLQKVKAIVEDVLICGIQTTESDESVTQVIANFDLVTFPENVRMRWVTLNKEDGKRLRS